MNSRKLKHTAAVTGAETPGTEFIRMFNFLLETAGFPLSSIALNIIILIIGIIIPVVVLILG